MTHTYTKTHTDLPVLKAGIYRHYKGPLYLVLGYAHDANADGETLCVESAQSLPNQVHVTYLTERNVVVYLPLEGIKDETIGSPRLAVRTHEDFFAWVDPLTGEVFTHQDRGDGIVPRFQYVSAQWTGDRA